MNALIEFYGLFECIMFAVAVSIIARRIMHRRSRWWTLGAIFFGPIILLALLLVGPRRQGDKAYYEEPESDGVVIPSGQ